MVAWLNRRNSATDAPTWYVLPECPRDYFVAYLVPYSSPFLEPLNRMLYRLQSTGVLDYLSRLSYTLLLKQENKAEKDSPSRVSLLGGLGHQEDVLGG